MQTLKELLNKNAKEYSDKTAFIFENKRYTFKQVNQRINSLINALASMGVRKGDRVAILAYNCPLIELLKGGALVFKDKSRLV